MQRFPLTPRARGVSDTFRINAGEETLRPPRDTPPHNLNAQEAPQRGDARKREAKAAALRCELQGGRGGAAALTDAQGLRGGGQGGLGSNLTFIT